MKNGKKAIMICVLMVGLLASGFGIVQIQSPEKQMINLNTNNGDGDDMEWHDIYKMDMKTGELIPTGEYTSTSYGFRSCFLLDFAQVPFTVLKINGTNWQTSPNVHAYADADGWNVNCKSADPFFIVVRARFTRSYCYNEGKGKWEGNRTKCTISFSENGGGTVTQTHYCNQTTSTLGGGVASDNNSANYSFYANYWFSDAGDGYVINDDSTLVISSIIISAKY